MENVVERKSFEFAVKIVTVTRKLRASGCEHAMANQLMKSGTSIGANISEAQQAQSRDDFIAKMSISLKEANETRYWIRLLKETKTMQAEVADGLIAQTNELISLLSKIIQSAKAKRGK